MHTDADATPTPIQKRAMRSAVMVGCTSSLGAVAFTNGLLLLMLTAMDFSSERIMIYLSLPWLVGAVLSLPFAVMSDRFGKKVCANIAIIIGIVSFGGLTATALSDSRSEPIVAVWLGGYCICLTLWNAGWFAILSPVVPEAIRGRFFARLRVSWQTVNVVFSIACALYLSAETPLPIFGGVLGVITLGQFAWFYFYTGVPELEPSDHQPIRVREAMMHIFRTEGFMPFCAYMFLLTLATAGAPILFGLIEKRVLGYGDDLVVWLGGLYMVGAVIGFAIGGRMVDRFGTKPVFLVGHFGYAAVLLIFMLRGLFPEIIGVAVVPVALANFGYGFFWAYASIAVSTEMLALIPQEYKSLSTSTVMTFIRIGAAGSGLLTAWMLRADAFKQEWTLGGLAMTQYDTVLLFCAGGVLLLVVTLGLVPSVLHKAQWVPRQY